MVRLEVEMPGMQANPNLSVVTVVTLARHGTTYRCLCCLASLTLNLQALLNALSVQGGIIEERVPLKDHGGLSRLSGCNRYMSQDHQST